MSAKNIYLWVSCLALAAAVASCSSGAGSPILDSQDASAAAAPQDDAAVAAQLPAMDELMGSAGQADGKSVSYTPGLPALIGAGTSFPSVYNYGWRSGAVVDGATAPYVMLTSGETGPLAWNAYAFKELVAGSLQHIQLRGFGKHLAVFMYNWNAPSWGYFGTYDLAAATPADITVTPDYAPNGVTFMILVQLAPGQTTLNKIQTDVF